MDFSTICIWCWVIPLLVGVICAYLGYLIGKSSAKGVDTSGDLQILQNKNAQLEADLAACRDSLSTASAKTSSSSDAASIASGFAASEASGGTEVQAEAPTKVDDFNAKAAKAAIGKSIKLNDLKVIEGIGPKIENLFNNEGITTWGGLADLSVARCREIIMTGGDRYRLHDPASWPMQARMCAEGKWKDLARWQDDHKHGKL
ncbi:MAG: hypothetical protein KJO34_05325 [Deltaproteobacteria bacterium]|nr:hypothetical protein [Deltaproteobacteria bacterium]